jgi:nitronate monooxygenase
VTPGREAVAWRDEKETTRFAPRGSGPVPAAGGVIDGRGLAAALMLGADGVLMGTRFVAAEESSAPAAAKSRVVRASGDGTVRSRVFDMVRGYDWPPQYLARGREAALAAAGERERARYAAAAASGEVDTAVVFAGEGIHLTHAVEPAGVILECVFGEAEAALPRHSV